MNKIIENTCPQCEGDCSYVTESEGENWRKVLKLCLKCGKTEQLNLFYKDDKLVLIQKQVDEDYWKNRKQAGEEY